jgi:hypothetical protein
MSDKPLKNLEPVTTKQKIDILMNNFANMLKKKNENYGDSALNPRKIFSKVDAGNSILIRLDDKMNRIINSGELRKNDCADVVGYLILYMISNDWLNFDDQID